MSASHRRPIVAIATIGISLIGATALAAVPSHAHSKKPPVAYLTTRHGACKKGYEKATLHAGKGKHRTTDYVCVLKVTKTVTKTVIKKVPVKSPYQAANATIIGSGSNTAYGVVAQLGSIFNGLQGCNPISPASQTTPTLDFSCPSGSLTNFTGTSQSENPLNDVAAEEPAIGGSAGVTQLQYQGAHLSSFTGGKVAPINYASTVSGPSSSTDQGLNYVAYAEDGLSWFHFDAVGGTNTPSHAVTNLSTTQLQQIYNGTITNWDSVGGSNAPIAVYTASAGAGVRSVWEKFLGFDSSTYIESQPNPNAHIIPQNEDADILANSDAANAIFFFSVGRFNTLCGADGTNAGCTGGQAGTSAAIGQINGIDPTPANIYNATFPVTLSLYNVYSNGSNPNIPVASQPTLNFVSEDGFLCKPNTGVTDPTTGLTVRQDIDTAILQAGFLPLDHAKLTSGVIDDSDVIAPFTEDTGVTHPADITKAPYASYDLSGSNPTGYCKVKTSDTTNGPQ